MGKIQVLSLAKTKWVRPSFSAAVEDKHLNLHSAETLHWNKKTRKGKGPVTFYMKNTLEEKNLHNSLWDTVLESNKKGTGKCYDITDTTCMHVGEHTETNSNNTHTLMQLQMLMNLHNICEHIKRIIHLCSHLQYLLLIIHINWNQKYKRKQKMEDLESTDAEKKSMINWPVSKNLFGWRL